MASRKQRKLIANETIKLVESGRYTGPSGQWVDIQANILDSIQGSVHFAPHDFDGVFRERDAVITNRTQRHETRYIVENRTTFSAARKLLDESESPVFCLNFASAKNPGGGFLSGSQAQEECLARASGLYASINRMQRYYEINRECGTSLYTDHMIYSPAVPVFRNDNDELIDDPYFVSILTSPAVNYGAVIKNEPHRQHQIEATMLGRIDRLLAVATAKGYTRLVLGAWGCGVFRNDPGEVASWFAFHLEGSVYRGVFETVCFAVLDHTDTRSVVGPFRNQFTKEIRK